eukprot:6185992-Pleurochrysis_carterae.AAC.3
MHAEQLLTENTDKQQVIMRTLTAQLGLARCASRCAVNWCSAHEILLQHRDCNGKQLASKLRTASSRVCLASFECLTSITVSKFLPFNLLQATVLKRMQRLRRNVTTH